MALIARAPASHFGILDALPAARLEQQRPISQNACWHQLPPSRYHANCPLLLQQRAGSLRFFTLQTKSKRKFSRRRHARCDATPQWESVEPEVDRQTQENAVKVAEALGGVNVYLVGMMGSGKSTIGRLLAERLQYRFFDSDEVVEGAVGAPISQIFEENGEETFRQLETEVLSQLARETRSVISTGGGAVLRKENWSSMHYGISVFLQVPIHMLAKRVTDTGQASRPLLKGEDGTDEDAETKALSKLSAIWKERKGFYENADVTVSIPDSEDGEEEMGTVALVDEVLFNLEKLLRERGVKRQDDRQGWVAEP